MSLVAFEYAAYGRKFKVEQNDKSTRWHAIGRGAGMSAYVLDKLGDAADQDGMQGKLDVWAKRQGIRPINQPKAHQPTLGV
jgi:hypothetical protein